MAMNVLTGHPARGLSDSRASLTLGVHLMLDTARRANRRDVDRGRDGEGMFVELSVTEQHYHAFTEVDIWCGLGKSHWRGYRCTGRRPGRPLHRRAAHARDGVGGARRSKRVRSVLDPTAAQPARGAGATPVPARRAEPLGDLDVVGAI
jgi:hypothetical protein